jgi:twitching motility two-component system response regulator PilG
MSSDAANRPLVLAVDDSPIIQQLIKHALEAEYRVIVTGSPVEALTMIYHEAIAVLLLDVTMPEIDGLELCRTVRNLPQFKSLPIIMITSKDTPFDKVQGRLAGATEYFTKPFDAEQLRQVIRRFTTSAAS